MSNRVARRVAAAVSAVGILIALAPAVVLGHAELATAVPADKASVAPPIEIVMTFTEPVDPAKSSLKLVDAAGTIVAEGSAVDASDAHTMRLPLSPQLPGLYTVRWTTASALDGDLDHGTTTFTITAAPPSPGAAASPSENPTAEPATASPSSVGPSAAVPSPTGTGSGSSSGSAGDAVIPVIAAVIILGVFGLWLLRSRSRRAG
jgi:methionine-rich copper-binding protein CopC